MRTFAPTISVTLVLVSLCAHAAQQQDLVGQDLAATIALHGMPCDKVVDSKRNGDSDYTATCQDGNRYHVFVDAQGRVVVQRLSR
jgi:hypothetical protein